LISNFCRVLNVVYFLLGNSPGSEVYMAKFRNRQSVPKRRHINFRRRGITQKKAYNIIKQVGIHSFSTGYWEQRLHLLKAQEMASWNRALWAKLSFLRPFLALEWWCWHMLAHKIVLVTQVQLILQMFLKPSLTWYAATCLIWMSYILPIEYIFASWVYVRRKRYNTDQLVFMTEMEGGYCALDLSLWIKPVTFRSEWVKHFFF
jgi:hypothetical protein